MKQFLLFLSLSLCSCAFLLSQEFEYITPENNGIIPGIMYEMVFDTSGNVWTCTWINGDGPGIATFDGEAWSSISREEGANSNQITSILEDSKGNLWFGSNFGDENAIPLGKFDGINWTYFNIIEDTVINSVQDITEDTDGNIWLATNQGAFVYDSQTFTQYTVEDGLASNSIASVIQDTDGNLWFGTADAGVSKFDGVTWETFTTDDGLATNEAQIVFQDSEGTLWIGSSFSGAGLTSFDGTTYTIYTEADGLVNPNVRDIFEDSMGNLWVAGFGASRFDGEDWFLLDTSNGLLDTLVRSVEEAPNGDIWFGSFDGISVLKAGSLSTEEVTTTALSAYPNPVKDILQIKNERGSSLRIKSIEIFDLLGNKVSSSSQKESVDVSNVSSGVYLARVTDVQGHSNVIKILKE